MVIIIKAVEQIYLLETIQNYLWINLFIEYNSEKLMNFVA